MSLQTPVNNTTNTSSTTVTVSTPIPSDSITPLSRYIKTSQDHLKRIDQSLDLHSQVLLPPPLLLLFLRY